MGVALFFGLLFVVDRALGRWGSAAIRRRPRPGLRVTVVFLAVIATFTLLALLARQAAARSLALGWAVLVLAFPATVAAAIAVDRALPDPRID